MEVIIVCLILSILLNIIQGIINSELREITENYEFLGRYSSKLQKEIVKLNNLIKKYEDNEKNQRERRVR